jgi:outer membrane protein TolC
LHDHATAPPRSTCRRHVINPALELVGRIQRPDARGVIDEALAKNLDLRAAIARVDSARSQVTLHSPTPSQHHLGVDAAHAQTQWGRFRSSGFRRSTTTIASE